MTQESNGLYGITGNSEAAKNALVRSTSLQEQFSSCNANLTGSGDNTEYAYDANSFKDRAVCNNITDSSLSSSLTSSSSLATTTLLPTSSSFNNIMESTFNNKSFVVNGTSSQLSNALIQSIHLTESSLGMINPESSVLFSCNHLNSLLVDETTM